MRLKEQCTWETNPPSLVGVTSLWLGESRHEKIGTDRRDRPIFRRKEGEESSLSHMFLDFNAYFYSFQQFPVDITSYLEDAGTVHGEKVLTIVFGMDCVPHEEIIPYATRHTEPLVHELFHGLFECTAVQNDGE